ncbi:hypothetical protein [uncultured Microbacterium sp.]|uniref:hypothetical protein n=1 Tax=uncultured Microbacterium sp. TaxID=191216 RepID=UPI0028E8DA54|nr:hypothetical protein [uncultured Microbacterium sp.]
MEVSSELSSGEGDYNVTIWGRRAFIEPLSRSVSEAPDDVGGLGWLQVLLDLVEQQGLQWREHGDPASGYPFSNHEDGMPPVRLSKLRATKPDVRLGHSPFTDRSNLSLAFKGTTDVNILLEVVAGRVPGVDMTIRTVADSTAYVWRYHLGKLESSESRGLGA